MIASRVVFLTILFSNCAALSMESTREQKITIQNVLDTIIKPQRILSDVALVTLYLHGGGNINAKGTLSVGSSGHQISGMNILMTSVYYDRPKLMKFIINQCYARLDCINEYGDTALHMAAQTGRMSMVRVLLASGADKSIRNKNNKTALEEAYSSPLRHHPFYTQKHVYDKKKHCNNHYFPKMIKLLECPDKKKTQYYNAINYIQQ